ncbi:hypothetical protein L7F22_069064 [Adiantum nelumboides]|nr:hypothetical protein [Adiantum nelumboides]
MARVETWKKVLANARTTKDAAKKVAQKMATKEAKKTRLEKAKALQEERRRLEAEKKSQDEVVAAQGVQAKEKEIIDITSTIEHLNKIEREKHIEEQRAAQLAREKIKEALRRKAEGPILEPREGSPKRPRQEDDNELENIQADPLPPSPKAVPPTPPSSPRTSIPPHSSPKTPSSPKSPKMPKSPPAPISPQQQQYFAEPTLVPPSSKSQDKQEDQPKDKADPEVKWDVKVEDRQGDMRDLVPVICSGDQYFDDQGFMYIVVLNPSIVDKWGMTGIKEKVDIEPEEAPPALNKPNLKLQRMNDMTRVNTDNIFLGLYKYDGGEHTTYYRCKEPLLRELTNEKKLYLFTYGKNVKTELIMTDKYGRSYVNVDPKELARYTYFGRPLPNYNFTPSKPEPFVKHTESMGYLVFPDARPILLKGLDEDENQDNPPNGTGLSTRGVANEPSNPPGPQSKPPPPTPKGNKQDDKDTTGTDEGSKWQLTDKVIFPIEGSVGVLTYRKRHKAILAAHPKAAYQYPRLSRFCYSVEDLHSEYGLSLEGKLPRDITDDELSDKDWLTVFKCLHQKNTKLYISSVREEFVGECRLLYQKVYQAAPSNGELLAKFARGFVYERSRASSDPDSRRIAWARFGEAVLDNCKLQKGGLERKINKFHADYGIVKLEASNCDVAVSSIPTISLSKLEGRRVVEQSMYMQQALSIAEGINKELD